MNGTDYSIRAFDLHYVFAGLECLALIALVGVLAISLLSKPNLVKAEYRSLSWVAVAVLVVALAGGYATDLYSYVHSARPGYVQLQQSDEHKTTGL